MFSLLFFIACSGSEPSKDEPLGPPKNMTQADLDRATKDEDYGLFAKVMLGVDETLRTSATERLLKYKGPKVAETVCRTIKNSDGTLNKEVAEALKGEARPDVAKCFATVIEEDIALVNRDAALTYFADLKAPLVKTTLDKVSKQGDSKPAHRVQAARLIALDPEYIDTAFLLLKEENAEIRAGALQILAEHPTNKEARKPIKESLSDSDPNVKAAAITAYYAHFGSKAKSKQVMCDAMSDSAPAVRMAAILAYKGFSRTEDITCLNLQLKRMTANKTQEDNPEVRQALIDTYVSAKGKKARNGAYNALCNAVFPWVKKYVTTPITREAVGVNIILPLNNAFPNKSLPCIKKANKLSKSSSRSHGCDAKKHLDFWLEKKSGKEVNGRCLKKGEEYVEHLE